MVPESQINDKIQEFVKRVRDAAGPNVEAIVLFGSAATADFHPGLSNVNLFCVLRDASFPSLQALSPAIKWWNRQRQPPPLCMTRTELVHSADVFAIELLDMVRNHRVLFGDDVLQGLKISTHLHRIQVEYELREKLILLRKHFLAAADDDTHLWDVLLHSVPSFATLFGHALIALGFDAAAGRHQAIQALSKQVQFDPSAFEQALNVREGKIDKKQLDVHDLCGRYLTSIEKVVAAVDRVFESETGHG